jgi:type III secretion protein C
MSNAIKSHGSPFFVKAVRRVIVLLFLGVMQLGLAHATTPQAWKDTLYSYRGGAAPLRDVLLAFSRAMGMDLRITEGVPLKATSGVESSGSMSPTAYMDRLAVEHQLQWFVYTGTLYVSIVKHTTTERITLGTATAAAARTALQGLGLFEAKFGWGELDASTPIAVVSGPSTYVELVRNAVGKGPSSDSAEPQLMVFRLRYATAADAETSVRERPERRRGVATTLRNMLATVDGPAEPVNASLDDLKGGTPSEVIADRASAGIGRTILDDLNGPGPIMLSKAVPGLAGRSGSAMYPRPRSATVPTIEAYPPLNAVLIRDVPERKKLYEELIASLDVPLRQVEILATIVDIDTDEMKEWSVGLTLGSPQASASFQPDYQTLEGGNTANAGSASPTVVLWSLDRLSLRIRALQSNGTATVIARPSILTMDNMEALLDLSQSAYFRLVGERTADLRSITVGTMLKVTPRTFDDGAGTGIRVAVQIEDGVIQNSGDHGAIPKVLRNSILTEAVVRTNEAIVIGGYRRDHVEDRKSAVPLLSTLPVIGRLFQTEAAGRNNRERLVILTARVVVEQTEANP